MKWVKRMLLGTVVLVLLAAGVIHAWSGMIIDREYPFESRNIVLSSRPDVIARGERLAQVFGCFRGCHGANMEGGVFFGDDTDSRFSFRKFTIGRIIAPNLTRSMDAYSLPELEAIIRQGVRPDGTSVLAMPSASFATMSDRDLSAILSFIRNYPEQEPHPGDSTYGVMPRIFLIAGLFTPAAAETTGRPWSGDFAREPLKLGEYLAMNACSECHGLDLEGSDGFSPPLTIARSYPIEEFAGLMSAGAGLGGRDLGLMSEVAKQRFSKMTHDEVTALHRFLQAR